MDSLTQIILGAAVGELALGRKIGNRAMIWGGIGGTIPDLDVIANSFMDSIDALAFHRGITHSIFFSVVAPVVFGWLVHQSYQRKIHKTWPYKIIIALINTAILVSLLWGINYLFREAGPMRWVLMSITVGAGLYLMWRLYKYYLIKDLEEPETTFRDWYWLFFLAFATHWLLDCFTAFGTQIFQPFSDLRVAFNNIAVADPFYTLPFLIMIVVASFFKRGTRRRALFTWLGLGISSLYMLWTIYNKIHVDRVFDQALDNRQIEVKRCHCSPTILNNILWSCVAEGEEEFYAGQYSLFDSDPNLHHLNVIAKNDSIHQMLSPYEDYQVLWWFSDGHLIAHPTDSLIILADMRYGGMFDTIRVPEDLIFKFNARQVGGEWQFSEARERPQGDFGTLLKRFIRRIEGY
jgi:inner membrane protein